MPAPFGQRNYIVGRIDRFTFEGLKLYNPSVIAENTVGRIDRFTFEGLKHLPTRRSQYRISWPDRSVYL